MISLRPYQQACIDAIRNEWQLGNKKTLVSLPTGSGKTLIFVFIIYMAFQNGMQCVVLVNTDELVEQTVENLRRVGLDTGIMKAQKNDWMKPVVVASVQTLSKPSRLYNLPPNHFGLVIVDECHYANSVSYQRILGYFCDAWKIGFTATPFRGDKKSLAKGGWDSVAFVYTIQEAIRDAYLVKARFVRVDTKIKLEGLKTEKKKGETDAERDFNAKELEKMINTPQRNNLIVNAALNNLLFQTSPISHRLRKTIVFCAGVQHTVDLANTFRQRGIEAFAIYGTLKEKARRLILKAHKLGRFPILCNCNILTHGYDDPTVEAIIMARPTESKVLYLQEVGRGLRPSPGKTDCVVLDVVDVANKHALTIGSELLALESELDEKARLQSHQKASVMTNGKLTDAEDATQSELVAKLDIA